jgi:serine/threonine protein phosphatase PrpC
MGLVLGSNEARIFCEQEHLDSECFEVATGEVALFSRRSPAAGSAANEDAAAILSTRDEATVLAVADGLGGAPAGQHASALALESLVEAVKSNDGELRGGILSGFDRANERVMALGRGAGTTLTVVEVREDSVRAYHVGDSFVLLTGNRGKVKMQSISHSPVGYGVESGLLDPDAAMHHDERHFVSNVVGTADMHIEVGSLIPMGLRDTLVLGSDGLSDNLHVGEIVQSVRKGSLASASRKLAQRAAERMERGEGGAPSKPDDLTFLLYRRSRA